MIVYQAVHVDCDDVELLSVHRTKEGAKKANQKNRRKERKLYNEMVVRQPSKDRKFIHKFGQNEQWLIWEFEVQP